MDDERYTVNPVRVLLALALDFLREGSSPDAVQAISDARAVTAYPGDLKLKAIHHFGQARGQSDFERLQNAVRSQRKRLVVQCVEDYA